MSWVTSVKNDSMSDEQIKIPHMTVLADRQGCYERESQKEPRPALLQMAYEFWIATPLLVLRRGRANFKLVPQIQYWVDLSQFLAPWSIGWDSSKRI
jgi:hypothetical protein